MKYNKGFTLIELLVVIVIISILTIYAFPSYQRQVIVSKRTEALKIILQIASSEEKHNANFNKYTSTIDGTGVDGDSLGLELLIQSSENYIFSVNLDDGYTAIAIAKNTSTQINDDFGIVCTTLKLNSLGKKTPIGCW